MPPKSATSKAKAPNSVASSTTKKPRGRPPKASSSSGQKRPGRPAKKVQKGGWIYTADSGTATESEVVDKGFPWVTSIKLDNHQSTDFQAYTHHTALLVSVGKVALTEHSPSKFTTTSEGALGGIFDNQSEVFIIDTGTTYKVTGLTKKCRYVLGLEVLDATTRDAMREREEIEWDAEMECDVVGKVTMEVRGEGDVGVLANAADDEDEEEVEGEGEGEQVEPATPSRFKHGDAAVGDDGGLVEEEEGKVVEKSAAGDETVSEEGDVGEEAEVKTPPFKKNGKGKGVKK